MAKTNATANELATDVYTGSLTSAAQSSSFNIWGAFNLFVYGTFVGQVQLERSFDGGTTWVPVYQAMTYPVVSAGNAPFTTTIVEPERGMLFRLNCTAFTSGTINWRASTSAKSVTYGA